MERIRAVEVSGRERSQPLSLAAGAQLRPRKSGFKDGARKVVREADSAILGVNLQCYHLDVDHHVPLRKQHHLGNE